MKSIRPFEEVLLEGPIRFLQENVGLNHDKRLEVLEAAASLYGTYSLAAFRQKFDRSYFLGTKESLVLGEAVLREIEKTPIPPPLAFSSLARAPLNELEKKQNGAYYTDFRLAKYLAATAEERLVGGAKLADLSSGTGILLAAASLVACGGNRAKRNNWLAECVVAQDLSEIALRGARLALASLTDDLGVVSNMVSKWRVCDSLLDTTSPVGEFDVVLGNPPWEKVKLTKHEHFKQSGKSTHYGAKTKNLKDVDFEKERARLKEYAAEVTKVHADAGSGELDLYKAFMSLSLTKTKSGGFVGLLVPAGLIRSQGTAELRRAIFESCSDVSISVIENRDKFFAIDTRFKFLKISLVKGIPRSKGNQAISICQANGSKDGLIDKSTTKLPLAELAKFRPDLSVPEVKSEMDWRIFKKMCTEGAKLPRTETISLGNMSREIDMTKDKPAFQDKAGKGLLPVVEGRMVHQHRFGAKAYVSGTGRRAVWNWTHPSQISARPQYWISAKDLSFETASRVTKDRVGFCDITGQTNERSMLAAWIPAGVVCGNKVPTILFENDKDNQLKFLWLAIVNSLPFDWALRKVVTTTINYFILRSVPLPNIGVCSLRGRRLVHLSKLLSAPSEESFDWWRMAFARAEIDILVLVGYGLKYDDLIRMLEDFPLLDRGQPSIPGEGISTITKDLILMQAAKQFSKADEKYRDRVQLAKEAGAIPYVPSEFKTPIAEDVSEALHA